MLSLLGVATFLLASLPNAGQAALPDLTQPPGLFIEADLVSGTLGPSLCVLQNRFAPGERVVFRARLFDLQTGQGVTAATVTVHFADGSTLPLYYSLPRPPPHLDYGPVGDDIWANVWVVPPDAPLGIVRYTIEAVAGDRAAWYVPLNVEASLLTVVPPTPRPLAP
jgi:hypothetical protein